MFLVDCQRCDKARLLGVQRIRGIRNLARGLIAIELLCYCGQAAVLVTGSGSGGTAPPPARTGEDATQPLSAPGGRPDAATP